MLSYFPWRVDGLLLLVDEAHTLPDVGHLEIGPVTESIDAMPRCPRRLVHDLFGTEPRSAFSLVPPESVRRHSKRIA